MALRIALRRVLFGTLIVTALAVVAALLLPVPSSTGQMTKSKS
jgi:hypothetical protein